MTKKKEEHRLLLPGVAAIAGAYFLYGAEGAKKNRKKIKGWMLKAKGEILERFEKSGIADESSYHQTVEKIIAKYAAIKGIDPAEVTDMAIELKKHWAQMMKSPAIKSKKKKIS